MATFALIHGSGDGGWAWLLVRQYLAQRGHSSVAPDLPTDRADASWDDCVDAVAAALQGRANGADLVVVGHSSGAFFVPLVAERLGAHLQVFVAGMVPQPGETASEWFIHLGYAEAVAEQRSRDGGLTGHSDPSVGFYHDVPVELAAEAAKRQRPTADTLAESPWPSGSLPDIPARYVVTAYDRFIPPAVQRRVAAERLDITNPDEIESGHCANLSQPEALADLLDRYVSG